MIDTQSKLREIENRLDLVKTYVTSVYVPELRADMIHVLTNELLEIVALAQNFEDQLWGVGRSVREGAPASQLIKEAYNG